MKPYQKRAGSLQIHKTLQWATSDDSKGLCLYESTLFLFFFFEESVAYYAFNSKKKLVSGQWHGCNDVVNMEKKKLGTIVVDQHSAEGLVIIFLHWNYSLYFFA